ncbi:MAG: cysteine protease [Cyanobacteria bacterium RYN_339]|nr:cysteine protease [Cyanobacteria bacterium RYN_339]
MKRLFLVALATLNIALTGCGHVAGSTQAPVQLRQAAAPTVMAAGHQRKLGFDLDRYTRQQAPAAQLHSLPPTQGIAPAKVDLRADASPVYDQDDLGSCTAFAVGKGMREFLQVSKKEAHKPLSALFLYYETRKLRHATETDSGATITDAIKAISTAGISTDATWSYDFNKFAIQPPAAAYAEAKANKLTTGVQLAGLEDVKKALLRHQPVVMGMRIYNTFRDVAADGKLPMPQAGDILVGGHAVTVLGFDNKAKVLIVKNSFGTEWGDKGYFYMPYAYFTPENVMDIWTAN